MKPSATQIFRSASPATCLFLLGSCLFIGFLSWALIPMHSIVDFQVDWPKLLFKSRPQIPCRDIIHVATSISRRDMDLSLRSFQLVSPMMSRHQSLVATSAQVFCSLQLVVHDVATSISCRDINLCLWKLHWLFFGVATSVLCRDNSLSHSSFIFSNLS